MERKRDYKEILNKYSKEELREILLKEMEKVGLRFSEELRGEYETLEFPEYFDDEE